MGDLVQSLGAVQALHEARPELEIAFVTQRENVPLLEGLSGIRHIVAHDRRGGLAAMARTRRMLRALCCDVALDLQGNFKSAVCAFLSGARDRIGAAPPFRQEPWSRLLLTRTVLVDGPHHPGAIATAVVRALAPQARAQAAQLAATAAEEAAAAAAVQAAGVDSRQPFTVIPLGRPDDPRSLQELAIRAELARGIPVLLLAGPGEVGVTAPTGVPIWRQGRGELRQLIGLGRLLRRVGGSVVAADQGPAHVLAAAGAPVTVLFGPQDPMRTAPPTALALQHPSPPSCMPCRARVCRHERGPVCMAFTRADGKPAAAAGWLDAPSP
jgi:ADP-heptose:LPS heptosyltransferase